MNPPTAIAAIPPGNLDHEINPHVLDTPQGRLIQLVCTALQFANLRQSNTDPEVFKVDGMSTHNVRHLINNLCAMPGARYLEVGSYKGSTLCAALSNNSVELAVAYENYTEFDQSTVKNDLQANIDRFKGQQMVKLMECDFFATPPLTKTSTSISTTEPIQQRHSIRRLPQLSPCWLSSLCSWSMTFVAKSQWPAR